MILPATAITNAAPEVSYDVPLAGSLTIHVIPTIAMNIKVLGRQVFSGLLNCLEHDQIAMVLVTVTQQK